MNQYSIVNELIQEVRKRLAHNPQLADIFVRCFTNTLETTIETLEDGTTFIVTGDIPALWLRDSSAQVNHYIPLARQDAALQRMIRGLIQRQARFLLVDPYASSFNREPNGQGHVGDQPEPSPWVWERKYELDSLCYPVRLCYRYWMATQDTTIFDDSLHQALRNIIQLMQTEQYHDERSEYRFERPNPLHSTDTLPFGGRGTRTNFTGMVWSGFRPSDDACKFGYLIPANMFAVVVLGYIVDIARDIYLDDEMVQTASSLRQEIDFGLQTYGIVHHPQFGQIYAYETDGYGNYNLMDDANVPSLLSIPYLGYRPADDAIYQNTRRFVLSHANPYYFEGKFGRGIGSPHTPAGYIWPMALTIRGLTAISASEQAEVLRMLINTTANTGYMHESFYPDNPSQFTRSWFAWANSLFAEFVYQVLTSGAGRPSPSTGEG